MEGVLWGLVIVGGPILLGLAVFMFGQRRRRLSQSEKQAAQQATKENWGKEQIR
jgi:uncharacterized protein HemX